MKLYPYEDSWELDDPHANFKEEVALYSVADPLPTLENLSKDTGIPVPALIRYILVKYTASGSDAILAMTPYALRQMQDHITKAESANSTEARLAAYEALRQMVAWLTIGPIDLESVDRNEEFASSDANRASKDARSSISKY